MGIPVLVLPEGSIKSSVASSLWDYSAGRSATTDVERDIFRRKGFPCSRESPAIRRRAEAGLGVSAADWVLNRWENGAPPRPSGTSTGERGDAGAAAIESSCSG